MAWCLEMAPDYLALPRAAPAALAARRVGRVPDEWDPENALSGFGTGSEPHYLPVAAVTPSSTDLKTSAISASA